MRRRKNLYWILLISILTILNGSVCLHVEDDECLEDHHSVQMHERHDDHADNCDICDLSETALPSRKEATQESKLLSGLTVFRNIPPITFLTRVNIQACREIELFRSQNLYSQKVCLRL